MLTTPIVVAENPAPADVPHPGGDVIMRDDAGRSKAARWLAAALAALALACASGGASAQDSELRMIEEVIRRAEAGEPENGFCRSTRWPPGDSLEAFTAYLNAASVGSWKINNFANGNCAYDRVTAIHQEDGGKCVSYTYWSCTRDGSCGVGRSVDCLDSAGVFVRRR
ncbi:MAG: hypothetical protein JNL07_05255 [Rhodospirillales bacterium]|nr:hypothetical protein [Rhodospirillales bacterium]